MLTAATALPRIGQVHIWRDAPTAVDPDCLSLAERERVAGMATPALRQRMMARRTFLRRTLAGYLDTKPKDVPLQTGRFGKPELPGSFGLSFSLSHSLGESILAVSRQRIGVDLEHPRPLRDWRQLANRVCAPREIDAIAASPDPDLAFLRRWVIKEAVVKCRGTGLTDALNAIDPPQLPFRCADGMHILSLPGGDSGITALAVFDHVSDLTMMRTKLPII